jgi:leader peptidase (prepilin peptidase)/N-methyltransferase
MWESAGLLLTSPFRECMALALGLIVGSFANVCIHRLPRRESLGRPPSHCPHCQERIRPWDNVPVLSYLVLRGRCRRCRHRISLRYPAVEAANGLAYLFLAMRMGASVQTLVAMALVTALLVLSLIDLEHQILPDVITLPGIAFGIAASLLPGSPIGWRESVLTAVGGCVALAAFALGWQRLRGEEAMGMGDWKMFAMLGAFLGWRKLVLTLFLATLSGSIVGLALIGFCGGSGKTKVPFGTFLGLGGIAAVFAGDFLVAWYGGFFGG